MLALGPSVGAGPVPDFVQERYASNLPGITDLEWGPNGMLYVAQKHGTVQVIANGVVVATAVDIAAQVNNAGERGLLGIALHPELLSGSPYLYLLHSYDPPETAGQVGQAGPDGGGQRVSRLTRFTLDAATGHTSVVPGSEVTILGAGGGWSTLGDPAAVAPAGSDWACGNPATVDDCLPADADTHGVGTVRFGPDGMLYVGSGDGASFSAEARSLRALDLDSLAGKIMRVDPDTGLGLADNPYAAGADLASNRARVWHLGLRNPYRFTFDASGALWIGDVGSGSWEELDRGPGGADFGWPCYEGGAPGTLQQNPDFVATAECQAYYSTAAATPPAYSYDHTSGSAAIIVGEIVPASSAWPAPFPGSLIVADYVRSEMSALGIMAEPAVTPFATGVLAVDIAFGPDGQLYLADIAGGAVDRIRYAPGQVPPGLLRVTSAPASPTMIQVDGLDRSEWGLDWLMTEPGSHEICFGDVPGLVTPPCRTVTVSPGVTASSQGDFVAQGTVVVSATVAGTGAGVATVVSLDGVPVRVGGVSTMRDPGPIEVCWGAVADLQPPPCQTANVTAGTTTAVDGVFTPSPGAPGPVGDVGLLRVTTSPSVPTTVLLDGQPVTQWSTEWVPVPAGTHEVCFTDVPGRLTPPCRTLTIVAGATTASVGEFTAAGSLRATTEPPTDVVISVDGVARNNWGLLTHIPAGSHNVCAHYVAGAVCVPVVLSPGVQTAVQLTPTGPPNQAPTASAGIDVTLVDTDGSGAELVPLDGSGSFDPDGTIVAHTWREAGIVVGSGPTPMVSFAVGLHTVELTVTDDDGATATDVVQVTVDEPPVPPDVVYLGADAAATVPGLGFDDEDIVSHDRVTDTWSLVFDGSDVGVTTDLNGFTLLADGSILMTFAADVDLPGPLRVRPWDIARFVPSTLGSSTSGTFALYFDGRDVELRSGGELIDALATLPGGDLLVSISGVGDVPGVGAFDDEDILRFSPTSLGGITAGTWSMWFDGSDVDLATDAEDVDGVSVGPTGAIHLTTLGGFEVPGLSGGSGDVFVCGAPITGPATACTYTAYWLAAEHGLTADADGLHIAFG